MTFKYYKTVGVTYRETKDYFPIDREEDEEEVVYEPDSMEIKEALIEILAEDNLLLGDGLIYPVRQKLAKNIVDLIDDIDSLDFLAQKYYDELYDYFEKIALESAGL